MCPVCGYSIAVKDGKLVEHTRQTIPSVTPVVRCAGSGWTPEEQQ